MKVILKYKVIKEKIVDINDETFSCGENIRAFWEKMSTEEESNVLKIEGIKIKDLGGSLLYN
jgi:hypothetical protein